MLEAFSGFNGWWWMIIGALLVILETIVPGVFLVWFGAAAFVTGIAALLFNFAWQYQVMVFAALALTSVIFARRFAEASDDDDELPNLNKRADQYIGRTFTLDSSLEDGRGRMRVGDSTWMVEGPELGEGAKVTVTAVRGNTLIVEASA